MQESANMHIPWQNIALFIFLVIVCNTGFSGTLQLDKYHSHEEMTLFLKNISSNYPKIASLYTIGNSTWGRELWVVEITGNSTKDQVKPNVKLVANIHGNEVVGRELLLHFIQYLVTSYNTSDNNRVTQLLDYARVHILPCINPDGFELALSKSKPEDISTCNKGPGRNNKRGLNLNRNFPDYFRKNTKPVQAETVAVKNWLDKTPFVLSACLHGGSLVASYPFDNTPEDTWERFFKTHNSSDKSMQEVMSLWKQDHAVGDPEPSLTPDDDVFKYLAKVYAKTHPTMYKGEACPNTQVKFKDGIINGAAWYPFTGGMQDYNYMKGCMEVTMEISCCKFPVSSELPRLWNENREAMLVYLMQVMKGVHGNVTDKAGRPIGGALLRVAGRKVSFYSSPTGQFWRILLPGDYLLQVAANGYANKSVIFTVTGTSNFTDMKSTLLQVKLVRISTSTTVMKKQTTQKVWETTTMKMNNVKEPLLDEVWHPNSSEWKVGESKSGVTCKYFNSVIGLFVSLVFLF